MVSFLDHVQVFLTYKVPSSLWASSFKFIICNLKFSFSFLPGTIILDKNDCFVFFKTVSL